jgi:hypothetical protein
VLPLRANTKIPRFARDDKNCGMTELRIMDEKIVQRIAG